MTGLRDPLVADAISRIDAGDLAGLDALLLDHPHLASERVKNGESGYFADPYLLWFIAENPIRNRRLPANIVEITKTIIRTVRRIAAPTLQDQLDVTLGLVATGCVPRERGVQRALIETLIGEGARPGGVNGSLANREIDAARYLLDLGAPATLASAAILGPPMEAQRLAATATASDKTDALVIAAYLGEAEAVAFLLANGADPSARSARIHKHSTPLHQAAISGNFAAVQALVTAGACLKERDLIWNGTPSGWAAHEGHDDIAGYLRAHAS